MANNLNNSRGLKVSHETVRRTLIKMGYSKKYVVRGPNITPTHEKTRFVWPKNIDSYIGKSILRTNALFGFMGAIWTSTLKGLRNLSSTFQSIHLNSTLGVESPLVGLYLSTFSEKIPIHKIL